MGGPSASSGCGVGIPRGYIFLAVDVAIERQTVYGYAHGRYSLAKRTILRSNRALLPLYRNPGAIDGLSFRGLTERRQDRRGSFTGSMISQKDDELCGSLRGTTLSFCVEVVPGLERQSAHKTLVGRSLSNKLVVCGAGTTARVLGLSGDLVQQASTRIPPFVKSRPFRLATNN